MKAADGGHREAVEALLTAGKGRIPLLGGYPMAYAYPLMVR